MDSIFVVHGRDERTELDVRGFLRQITEIPVVVLHDEPNRGQTLIEKFEASGSRAGYAVVILTGDDVGRASDAATEAVRARQNVIWEFGFFVGAIGRSHVAVLYEDGV